MSEQALRFTCAGSPLYGVLHRPAAAAALGVVVVVGGPQYRVGSHRQFVLLARQLSAAGYPVLRFDYRGMGDSGGETRSFEQIDADIAAAIDALHEQFAGLRGVVLWGLCDAASAIACYAPQDPRVGGLVLLNPWVRTAQGEARAYIKHYYLRRLFEPSLWQKLLSGHFKPGASLTSFIGNVAAARSASASDQTRSAQTRSAQTRQAAASTPLPDRMLEGLVRFSGPVLVILSGDDLVAAEFRDTVAASRRWRKLLAHPGVTQRELPQATHTFSTQAWRDQVAAWTCAWLDSLTQP